MKNIRQQASPNRITSRNPAPGIEIVPRRHTTDGQYRQAALALAALAGQKGGAR
ncbi:MAG: hypothetical protein ABSD47_20280 [Candidatus Methylomirabilota bacterium]|jgi:hypothetical protein